MLKNLSMLGVPLDLGQNRRGVDMGPSAIRYAGVLERLQALGYQVQDHGDLTVPKRYDQDIGEDLQHLQAVVETNRRLAKKMDEMMSADAFPLVFGGDHSISIGTLAGISQHYQNLGVIWYDAHGDLNTAETSPSGNIHGMPLAVSLGRGHDSLTEIAGGLPAIKPENVVIIGARALDAAEKTLIQESGLKVFTMHEVDRLGMSEVMTQTNAYLSHCDGIHLSLDLDGLDPIDAPGVGTPVVGGLTYRESHLAMEMLAETTDITSCEFVEVNPILDEKNKTAEAAVALIGSLFGEKIK
ncbi:arginase [Natribacillus halophilus]|uniref:Arginase n=1 Tax=Natribacillus halophilus TaxID=549003 RepID=A0A1G8JNK8_9BACI|nr:arginase [Natribacillus halophilus]SDI32663.1 arginase [Natribacillus halophilus]